MIPGLLWADYFGRAYLGSIRGFTAPFRFFSPIGPTLAGFIHDRWGSYNLAFSAFAGIFFIMLLAMSFATPPVKPTPEVVEDESQVADA